jgi:hypothetical protein
MDDPIYSPHHDIPHGSRDEPRLGCRCRGCYYTRRDYVEKALIELYEKEQSVALVFRLPLISQFIHYYLQGECTYDEMKTRLICELWQRVQDTFKNDLSMAMLSPIIIPKPPAT